MKSFIGWNRNSRRSESGLYVVLFAIAGSSLLLLIALAIGLSLAYTASTRVDQLAGLASLSALKGYLDKQTAVPSAPYADLEAAALTRVNLTLAENRLPGSVAPLGNVSISGGPGDGGELSLGAYFPEAPALSDPCLGNYPCFVSHATDPSSPVNAARLKLRNQASNPVIAPFAHLLGADRFRLESSATASFVQTCAAYVVDISFSSILESHELPTLAFHNHANNCPGYSAPIGGASPPAQGICPPGQSFFAYQAESLKDSSEPPSSPLDPLFDSRCANASYMSDPFFQRASWCNVSYGNGLATNYPSQRPHPSPASSPVRQSYIEVDSPFGKLWVDSDPTRHPEPLRSFFLAINTGISLVANRASIGDRGLIIPFTGRIRNPYPPESNPASQRATTNLDLLMQLSNFDNRPRIGSYNGPNSPNVTAGLYPNALTMGWLPVITGNNLDTFTHITGPLYYAATALAASCPGNSRKLIVLITDGIAGCRADGSYSGTPLCQEPRTIDVWDGVRRQLFEGPNVALGDPPGPTILEQLKAARISLSVILRGDAIAPNFLRQINPTTGALATPRELFLLGQPSTAIFNGDPVIASPLLPGDPTNPEENAYALAGVRGALFRRPNQVLGHLALASGGEACPILRNCTLTDCPACTVSCYKPDGTLDACALPPNPHAGDPYQNCSLRNESIGAQAARCISDNVGGNAFILVEK